MQRKSTYYVRLLLSYALAVSIPVVLLCAVIYNISYTRLQEEMISSQRLLLAQAAQSLNLCMQDSYEMSNAISIDNEIINLSESRAPDLILQGVRLLKKYNAGNTFLGDIIIKHGGERTLYTPDGTVYEDVLLTKQYGFTLAEKAYFQACASDTLQHLHYFKDAKVIMRFVPIPVFTKQKSGCAIFVINQGAFTRLFASDVKRQYGALLLLDDQDQRIYQLDQNGILTEELFANAISNLESTSITYDHEKYHLISMAVEESNWRLVSLLSDSWIKGRLYNILLIGVTLTALILAGVLTFVGARYQYKPIHALSRTINENAGKPGNTNELETIRKAIDSSVMLGEQVELQRNMLRESLLLRLLQGDNPGQDEMDAAFDLMDQHNQKASFRVVILKVHSWQRGNQEELIRHVRDTYQNHESIFVVEDGRKRRVMLVINCGDQGLVDQLPTVLNGLYDYVGNTLRMECSFGVGNPCPFDRIAVSYLEASVALDQQRKEGIHRIVYYSSFKTTSQFLDDFQRQELMLVHAIRLVNRPMTEELLETVLTDMQDRYTVRNLSSYYRLRLIEALVHLSTEDAFTQVRKEDEMERLSALVVATLSPCTHDEYAHSVGQAVNILLGMADMVQNQKKQSDVACVQQWITKNVRESVLSLDMLSSEMGFSPAYWSRFCREKLHVSFQEHVWQLRLALTKDALVHTRMPIKQIVMEVGYLDVSTFIRRFRQEEGMTPGQYRALHENDTQKTGGANE